MTKREIKARLKTLDKVEAMWREERFEEWMSRKCPLCELYLNPAYTCFECTVTLASVGSCINICHRGQLKNSIRPIMDAIRKMRKYLEAQL
jgi:hypothetical protein